MDMIVYFTVCFVASTIGAISGIGGGIIIKPVLDSMGRLDHSTINFLSGCAVLAMATVSFLRSGKDMGEARNVTFWLAGGGAGGGIVGKSLFSALHLSLGGGRGVGLTQSALLLAINILVMAYLLLRYRLRTRTVRDPLPAASIGFVLGLLSSFLGIGGGPVNIAVLNYFFSMKAKRTAMASLFVILCSQFASLANSVVASTIPPFDGATLVVMCAGAVAGAMTGRSLSANLRESSVERLFFVVLLALIVLNLFNLARFAL